MTFIPSKYQKEIFKFALEKAGHLVIQSCAGSGKSTTLVELYKILVSNGMEDIIFLAFNKDIVLSLKDKLGENAICKTLNSLGHQSLLRLFKHKLVLDNKKYFNIVKSLIDAKYSYLNFP